MTVDKLDEMRTRAARHLGVPWSATKVRGRGSGDAAVKTRGLVRLIIN